MLHLFRKWDSRIPRISCLDSKMDMIRTNTEEKMTETFKVLDRDGKTLHRQKMTDEEIDKINPSNNDVKMDDSVNSTIK
ncbi:unnamed protein product [Hymenolepis diminuta]|uniref:Uncharacterized protein n=1 Tax=Hymenolepis diminuta TaxID=6216 RepID=A0A0R3SI30_HYMDI|nr:unnamed protein product [Hymenolepis diminuta]